MFFTLLIVSVQFLSVLQKTWLLVTGKGKKRDVPASFDDLPDECLGKVFKYLDVTDRVRIERVCERWQSISKSSWKEVTDIHFTPSIVQAVYFTYSRRKVIVQIATIHIRLLRSILSRCGPFANSLSIGDNESAVESLWNSYIVGMITDHCNNISHLSIHECYFEFKEVAPLLVSINRLKGFEIIGNGKFLSKCLGIISTSYIENVYIRTSTQTTNFELDVWSLLENTSVLRGVDFNFIDKEILQILRRKRTFTNLTLKSVIIESALKTEFLSFVRHRDTLEEFHMFSCAIDDDCMIAVAANWTNLRSLTVSSGRNITPTAFTALCSLPNLTTVHINDAEAVDGNCLECLPTTVTNLTLKICDHVTDNAIIPLIYRLTNLAELDVSHCPVTIRILEEAVIATRLRTNDKWLRIRVPWGLPSEQFRNKIRLIIAS